MTPPQATLDSRPWMPDAPPCSRIAIVLPALVGGGMERVCLSLANAFLAAGYAVDIVLARATGELLGMVPGDARLFSLGCRQQLAVPAAFARYLRRERPDAVIAHYWPLSSLCLIGHRLARSPARIAVVQHSPLSPSSRCAQWHRRWRVRAVLAATFRLADARIGVSAGVADDIARLGLLPRSAVTVIHNPVEMPPDGDSGPADPEMWGGTGGKRILTVGRLAEEKNHALLVEALAWLRRRVDARLVILGEGPLRPQIERRAAALGLGDAVRLPGFVADPWPAYRAADLFALSSDYEGFSNVIVEALATGLPVVSTDCPSGPREVLDGGAFGRLVAPGDAEALGAAMLEALTRPRDPERLRARAREFTVARAAGAYLRAVLGARGGA